MTTLVVRFSRPQASWVNPLVIRFVVTPPPDNIPWGKIGIVTDLAAMTITGQQVDTSAAFGGNSVALVSDGAWFSNQASTTEHVITWADIASHAREISVNWADIAGHAREYGLDWKTAVTADIEHIADWNSAAAFNVDIDVSYYDRANIGQLDFSLPVGSLGLTDIEHSASYYGLPAAPENQHDIKYGFTPGGWHCSTNYRPPKGKVTIDFSRLQPSYYGTFAMRFTASAMVCDYDDGGGYLDGNTDLPSFDFTVPIEPQIKRLYLMQPTLSVRRVSDNDEIAVTSVNISDSRGQFSTSVSLEFASKGDMLLAMNELLHIEINGYDFYAIPEQASQRRSFNATQYSASGRCASAALAAPWKLPISYSNAVDRSFAGICGDILTGTGWTVELVGFTDFTVPAKVFSSTGKAPAETINEMADMIGCMVLSDDANNKLKILPKFPVSPWSMAGATPAIAVHESVIISYGATDEINQLCNTCWVRGEQQGVSRQIRRTGTAGNIATADISNALIVTDTPARLAGTAAIAATGQKQKVSVELPVMNDLPPLVKGMLVGVSFYGDTYKATCDTTGITATVQNDGSIDVTQSVTLIRHME